MKHTQSICTLALALSMAAALCAPALAAQEEETWTRSEAGGKYVTLRLSYPDGPELSYIQEQALAARYADTGEPIALTSVLYDTALFVTVPAENAGRPIEVYQAAPARFDDCANEYTLPLGTQVLNARGIVRGTGKGNLSPSSALTRAEAFTLIVRLLDLPVPGDENWQGVGNKTWFSDVSPDAWYYDTAAAALAADGAYTYEDTDGGTTVRVTVYPDEDHSGEWAYTLTIDDPAILEDGGETTITSYGSTADGSVSGGDVTASFWEPQENTE